MRKYDISDVHSGKNKDFLTYCWEFIVTDYYEPFDLYNISSTKQFLACTYIVVITNLIDLSHFFNKYVLHIPSDHFTLVYRVNLWGWISCIAIREFYVFIKE